MKNRLWIRCDHLMRVSHLYTGLFLVPWMLVYAVSAFCLNHSEWFTKGLHLEQKWENIREESFTPGPEFPQNPEDQAVAILKHLNLDGPHRIMGNPNANQLVIFRYCARGHYRISWLPQRSSVVVDKQLPASFYSMVNALHFQYGYHPYFASLAWAAVVDAVTISTVIWVISGIWLWARRTRKRFLGGMCMIAGSALFVVLVIILSR